MKVILELISSQATRGALGQPLGVQVVALPWMEEQLLAGMQDIETAINKHYRKS